MTALAIIFLLFIYAIGKMPMEMSKLLLAFGWLTMAAMTAWSILKAILSLALK